MFKKLRNKFIINTMIIVSFTLLLAGSSIIIFMHYDLKDKINSELNKPMIANPPDRIIPRESLIVMLDNNSNINRIVSSLNIDYEKEYLNSLVNKVINNKDKIYIIYNNEYYSFSFNRNNIHIINTTDLIKSFQQLIQTLIIVGIVILIISLIFSFYYSSLAIKPIEETFNKQKEFISNVSHEFKTPLASIKANLDLIKNKNNLKWSKYIDDEINSLNILTDDLLYLSKENIITLEKEDLNISNLLEEIIMTFESRAFELNKIFDLSIKKDIKFNGNRNDITRLFKIIIDNSIKYSLDNKIFITLDKDNKINIIIKNKTKNIKEIEKLFDRFYRDDESRNKDINGYGLGLSIAKEIVNNHKGKIKAQVKDKYFTIEIIL